MVSSVLQLHTTVRWTMTLGESHLSRAMWRHLIECFERRQVSASPLALGDVNRNPEKHQFVLCLLVYKTLMTEI